MAVVFFLDIYYCIIIAWTLFYLIFIFTALQISWHCPFNNAGVGIATMAVVFFLDIYYCIIIAWTFFYLIATFTALPDLPWNTCGKRSMSKSIE
jgi:SNF family Na+-dependent transporter